MLSRDLIATVVKTFFEELDDVREGGKKMDSESLYAGFYSSYFNRDREWVLKIPVSELTCFLADEPIHKLEMLVELMLRDTHSLADANIQRIIYQKVLELYDIIDVRSMEFSLERMAKRAELKYLLEQKRIFVQKNGFDCQN